MSGGRKPDFKLCVKSKTPGADGKARRQDIAVAWRDEENGKLRTKFDRDVVAIKFADGSVARPGDVYVDLYDNTEPRESRGGSRSSDSNGEFGDDSW